MLCKAQQTPPPWCHVKNSKCITFSVARRQHRTARRPQSNQITNKLTFDPPTRLPELTQNLIRSSHGHCTPSLKMSCKSVQSFSRNVAEKETNKEIARILYPSPYRGRGNNSKPRRKQSVIWIDHIYHHDQSRMFSRCPPLLPGLALSLCVAGNWDLDALYRLRCWVRVDEHNYPLLTDSHSSV